MNPQDMADLNIEEKQLVNITSHFEGQQRKLEKFIAIPYNIPRGNTAAYYPEANHRIALDDHDRESGTPSYKSVPVILRRATSGNR